MTRTGTPKKRINPKIAVAAGVQEGMHIRIKITHPIVYRKLTY